MQFYDKLKYLYRAGRFRRLLDKDEIRFILSYLKKNDSIFDVFNYLHCLNYSGYFFLNGTVHEIEKFNPEIHQQHGTKDYVNNFLFSVDALRQI